MDCREFKEQFDDTRKLSKEANSHLAGCQNCGNLQLTAMISGLPRVEAPKDFAFGVKAKLAETHASKPISPIWRILRLVLPVSAAALIFSFVIINSSLFTQESLNTEIAKDKNIFEMELVPETGTFVAEEQVANSELLAEKVSKEEGKLREKIDKEDETGNNHKALNELAENKTPKNVKKDSDDEIISRDIVPEAGEPVILSNDKALTIPKVKNPLGINPNKKINKTNINPNAKSFTAKEILTQLGIETEIIGGGLKVKVVRQNSLGARVGVKTADVVTAIDGNGFTQERSRRFQGKSLTVKRGNKILIISLHSKQ